MIFLVLSLGSVLLWAIILCLPWRPWSVSENLDVNYPHTVGPIDRITVLIPARDEEQVIENTLLALKSQGHDIQIIVIDDCSSDKTAEIAKRVIGTDGMVLTGRPLPKGWSGKLWALEQGLCLVKTPMVLLMDADIILKPGILSQAQAFMKRKDLDFLSLMAELSMKNLPERLFMPAFVYFFKLLYPFRLSNRPRHFVAAAAGGFILTKTKALRRVKAFESIKDALIDDCSLAKKIKGAGFSTWIGLSRWVLSSRRYPSLNDIWQMVERTAFTQLHYSWALLLGTTVVMGILFIWPVAGILTLKTEVMMTCLAALTIMCITYLPILRYYGLPVYLCLTLPPVALLYMAMTWSSSIGYLRGEGAKWKKRQYRWDTPNGTT